MEMSALPPLGSPHAVALPGTETATRSAVYRHWAIRDGPLITSFDPAIQTTYDIFEDVTRKYPNSRALGTRPWNPQTKTWESKYTWITFAEATARSRNLGAGLVEINKEAGITDDKYGIGLWSQNRAEWQISGTSPSQAPFSSRSL